MIDASSSPAREVVASVQRCINPACKASFALRERIFVCGNCGGALEIVVPTPRDTDTAALQALWRSRAASLEPRDRSGVWRFREMLPFDSAVPVVSLSEGNTPLYNAPRCAKYSGVATLLLKHQGCNPTGSFKDTGMTTCVTQAVSLGASTVVCASTGNTSASLAAYAARAGLSCGILLPRGQTTSSKLAQSIDYGATVCEIDGNFDDCMRLIQEIATEPSIYLANSINPFRIEGQKTAALELMEQRGWLVPDHVVVPGGNMGNSSALGKGFEEMLQAGLIKHLPKLSVIQAAGSAPLADLFASLTAESKLGRVDGYENLSTITNPQTLATAIKIGSPVSWKKTLRYVVHSGGEIISVSEEEIADAKAMIGRDGIGCEPASATTVAGIRKLVALGFIRRDQSVVAVLTGHVLKDPDYVSNYHRGTLSLETRTNVALHREAINGAFRNASISVPANKDAILAALQTRNP